jgi:outer membrane protein assembly factor BamE (lipoprotein component of BamABCDE complex)
MASLKRFNKIAFAGWLATSILLSGGANACSAEGTSQPATRVLRDQVFRQIQPGFNAGEVLAIIGAPHRKSRFEATKTTAWDYSYRDTWGYEAEFSVILDDAGVVVGKFSGRKD